VLCLVSTRFGGLKQVVLQCQTDVNGGYSFKTTDDTLRQQLLAVEVFRYDDDGNEIERIALSKPMIYPTPESRTNVTLVAPRILKPMTSEYEQLKSDLLVQLGNNLSRLREARENAEYRDITVLSHSTGWDARLIALSAVTEQLQSSTGLQRDGIYALLRAGLPSDQKLLAKVAPEVVEATIRKMASDGIVQIPETDIAGFKDKFINFAADTMFSSPIPGSTSTHETMLVSSGLDAAARKVFKAVYLQHRGSGAQLWEAAEKAGLNTSDVASLKLQGKLAFLAGNSETITTRLMKKLQGAGRQDLGELVQQGFHNPDTWKLELFKAAVIPPERHESDKQTAEDREKLARLIPTRYPAADLNASLGLYTEDMARKLRIEYPTQVLGHLIENDDRFKA
jgi:hypothetical protein